MTKKKDTANLRQQTGLAPISQDPTELTEFFGDAAIDPKTGEPILNRPVQVGETVLDGAGNEVTVTEENIQMFGGERPTPKYQVGDRDLDIKSGEIKEVHAINAETGEITWGPLTGATQGDGTPAVKPETTPPAGQGEVTPSEGPAVEPGKPATVEELQQKLQAQEALIEKVVPERLRKDRDPLEALEQLGTSYTEAEKKISEQGGTINRYREIMGGEPTTAPNTALPAGQVPSNFPQRTVSNPAGTPLPGFPSEAELAEISDEDFTYKPRETNEKLMMGLMAKFGPQLAAAVVDSVEGHQLMSFRAANPEWDHLWAEGYIPKVLQQAHAQGRPLDSPMMCGEVLRRSKLLKEQRLEELKAQALAESGVNPEATKQQTELFEQMAGTIKDLQSEIKGLKDGIPEAVEKVHAQKVQNAAAFVTPTVESGGGAAVVKAEADAQPTQPQKSVDDLEFEAIQNATPSGRESSHKDPKNAAILAMMKGKVYNEDSDKFE